MTIPVFEENENVSLLHSPLLPQPSAGQIDVVCQSPDPVVELETQARLSHDESVHWPQQQRSPGREELLYLQSLTSRFVQGLPGEARPHSDK